MMLQYQQINMRPIKLLILVLFFSLLPYHLCALHRAKYIFHDKAPLTLSRMPNDVLNIINDYVMFEDTEADEHFTDRLSSMQPQETNLNIKKENTEIYCSKTNKRPRIYQRSISTGKSKTLWKYPLELWLYLPFACQGGDIYIPRLVAASDNSAIAFMLEGTYYSPVLYVYNCISKKTLICPNRYLADRHTRNTNIQIAISKNAERLAVTLNQKLFVYNLKKNEEIYKGELVRGLPYRIDFNKQGTKLGVFYRDIWLLHYLDTTELEQKSSPAEHENLLSQHFAKIRVCKKFPPSQ